MTHDDALRFHLLPSLPSISSLAAKRTIGSLNPQIFRHSLLTLLCASSSVRDRFVGLRRSHEYEMPTPKPSGNANKLKEVKAILQSGSDTSLEVDSKALDRMLSFDTDIPIVHYLRAANPMQFQRFKGLHKK